MIKKINKYIVEDSEIHFGQATIAGTRIFPEIIYKFYKAGNGKNFIAGLYDLTLEQVQAAIDYCNKAARTSNRKRKVKRKG